MSINRWLGGAACAAALIGGLAACGDDDDGGSGSTTTTAQKQSFTGKPVTVYFQGALNTPVSDLRDTEGAIKAAIARLNASGGLRGSRVDLKVCNDSDANAELECVRAAKKAGAIAFVGSSFIFNPKAGQKALGQAGIPSVAPLAIYQSEYSEKVNYPIFNTAFGLLACGQDLIKDAGAKKVSIVTQDLPVQKELLKTLPAVFKATNVPYGKGVAVPTSQTDYSAPVKQLLDSGADGLINILVPGIVPSLFGALQSVGKSFKAYCMSPSSITFGVARQLGKAADDIYVSIGLPPIDEESATKYPLVKEFRDDLGEDGLKKLYTPGNALNGWLAVKVLEQAAANVDGKITNATLTAALDKLKPDLSGAGLPPIDFSKPVPAPGLERLFNPIVGLQKWDSSKGNFVATDSKPVNVLELFAALQKASG